MLPLTEIIFNKIGNDTGKRKALLVKMGFTNPSKGNEVLNELIAGKYKEKNLIKLKQALGIDSEVFYNAVYETELILEIEKKMVKAKEDEENKKKFVPYLEIEFEKFNPSSNMNASSLSHYKKPIELGHEILNLRIKQQIEYAAKVFMKSYGNYKMEHPLYSSLGDILSIKYYFDYYYCSELDLNYLRKKSI